MEKRNNKLRAFFWIPVALLHIYLGTVHMIEIFDGKIFFEHIWKSSGAYAGAVVMLILAFKFNRIL